MAALIVLTPAQARDLRRLVERHRLTVGTYDYPNGDALRLRTGNALERRGLVYCANRLSANRSRRFLPTPAGFTYVQLNFRYALEECR